MALCHAVLPSTGDPSGTARVAYTKFLSGKAGAQVASAAARVSDSTAHGILLTGAGCPSVTIRKRPAWRAAVPSRGSGGAAIATLQSAQKAARAAIEAAEAATKTAELGGIPATIAAAKSAEQVVKATQAGLMATTIAATVASLAASGKPPDLHTCTIPLPIPPNGPGLVVGGSSSVFIGGYAAARIGDQLVEAVGPPNSVTSGETSVVIGD